MKECLIIGNKNATTAKYVFPLIKDRILSLGYTVPKDYDQPPGEKRKSLQGLTRWFTTLPVTDKPPLVLTATYDPEIHKTYDNYDAINVDRIKDIPYDYPGVMGVPIGILEKNLDEVEVIDMNPHFFTSEEEREQLTISGEDVYARVLIKKNFEIDGCLYGDHTIIDGTYIKGHTPEIDGKHKYSRILIKTTPWGDKPGFFNAKSLEV